MSLEYKVNAPVSAEEVANVFRAAGLKRPVDQLERIQRMIDYADITITVRDGNKLIGIARAITDFSYCCYLSDLAVDKDYQKRGIGKQLIKELQKQLGEETSLLLLSVPDAMEYYPKVGFNKAENAFLIQRKR
ncbi:GNAT family N-acetyltransferase [Ammoniphilus resinae]|uniref:N-acetyltransferase YhbS n=1 Tax=Ammoniphilus resinae TaxID=861532 RepID=A0ABS4GR98_9BACL|nr:GNAT family N-acetyltransferase [Ammoniphilus resinae]MBP1932781.1 putative N-acetyltransferase YhbS [Ammoniphilus resinae]